MAVPATKPIVAHEISKRQVTVPEQTPSLVRDAHATAKSLGGTLATFKETIMDVTILQKAKEGCYLLAVDSKDVPKEERWYFVDRKNARLVAISHNKAYDLIDAGRRDEVLYVNKSAVDAAKEARPVALHACDFIIGKWHLGVDGWTVIDARVALSSEASAPQSQANELLRKING